MSASRALGKFVLTFLTFFIVVCSNKISTPYTNTYQLPVTTIYYVNKLIDYHANEIAF